MKPTQAQIDNFLSNINSVCDEVTNGTLVPGTGHLNRRQEPCCILGHAIVRCGNVPNSDEFFLAQLAKPLISDVEGFRASPSWGPLQRQIDKVWHANDGADQEFVGRNLPVAAERLRVFAKDIVDFVQRGLTQPG